MRRSSSQTFMADPRLVPRIKQLLGGDGSVVNLSSLEEIASALQKQYPEYGRKKRQPFTAAVARGLESIGELAPGSGRFRKKKRQRARSKSQPSSPNRVTGNGAAEDSFSSDNDNYVAYPEHNMVNSSLNSLYGNTPNSKPLGDNPKTPSFYIDTIPDAVPELDVKRAKVKPVVESVPNSSASLATAIGKTKRPPAGPALPDFVAEVPEVTLKDVGGYELQILEACRLLVHLKHPEIYRHIGVVPPVGFLLHGPPGCGKSLFVRALAGEFGINMVKVTATELVSGVSGETELHIRSLFRQAVSSLPPCIVVIEEIDVITPKKETATREMERRVVSQLMASLDEVSAESMKDGAKGVLVVGVTCRPDSLDPGLRRAGRFDKEIALGIPDLQARQRILEIACSHLSLSADCSCVRLSQFTPGFVGADLYALVREAGVSAIRRITRQLKNDSLAVKVDTTDGRDTDKLSDMIAWLKDDRPLPVNSLETVAIGLQDFMEALKCVSPSAKREGFATIPDVTWADIGGLETIRAELKWSILYPIHHPDAFEAMGLKSKPQGVLLCGPPGCGKTLLAKAIANETGMNFISVKGPELLNMYVGESERAVRQVFLRARNSAPCVIFFDELDALCPRRSDSEGSSGGSARVVNQVLTEMDGMDARREVFLIGATNRPDIIDPAVLRPGRLDKLLYVGFPSADERVRILQAITKNGTKPKVSEETLLERVANDPRTDRYTSADLAGVVREACVAALKEVLDPHTLTPDPLNPISPLALTMHHFDLALDHIKPSVSPAERKHYEGLKQSLQR